jgi:GNAT superfamily N-acetyltransferase
VSSGIAIRRATRHDVPVILELIRGLAEYERASAEEVPADEAALVESLFGTRPAAEVLLAFEEERALGFAVFFHNYSTWRARHGLYLEDLFVRPESRKRGIGKALLVELARIAVQRRCARMEWSVLDWNRPAIDFYLALGAAPMSEWTTFRMTEDAIARLAGIGAA